MNELKNKNHGMLLEKIIERSIEFYFENNIAIIHKLEVPIKIIKKHIGETNNIVQAKILRKSTVDYYGIFKGKFICFEAKSTELDYFYFKNIQPHQQQYMLNIIKHGGIAFYIIYFKHKNLFYLINAKLIGYQDNKTKISLEKLQKKGIELKILYPGIIDFIENL